MHWLLLIIGLCPHYIFHITTFLKSCNHIFRYYNYIILSTLCLDRSSMHCIYIYILYFIPHIFWMVCFYFLQILITLNVCFLINYTMHWIEFRLIVCKNMLQLPNSHIRSVLQVIWTLFCSPVLLWIFHILLCDSVEMVTILSFLLRLVCLVGLVSDILWKTAGVLYNRQKVEFICNIPQACLEQWL